MLKASKAEYHELNSWDVIKIRADYYLKTGLIYHVLIIFPPIIIVGLLIKNVW
jgi:hypothetical protein